MLNSLQGSQVPFLVTALERVAADVVTSLRTHERWASSPDALSCYWDELFNAICGRLEQLVEAPVALISTGPDREETIVLKHPFG